MPVKPISTNDATLASAKKELLPDFVIEAFNEMIASRYLNGSAKFKQDEVMEIILQRGNDIKDLQGDPHIKRHNIFDNHWLDVEEVYRQEGWKVEYDKPAYCETFDAYFVFRK
jgi:hypothetical protein